jgi:hypothetical protein
MHATTVRRWGLSGLGALLAVCAFVPPATAVPPGAATLVGPAGPVTGSTLTFTWGAVAGATFYYLQINDSTASPRLTRWYPVDQACPAASATCFVSVTTGFAAGGATWWVQTWNPDGLGPWSAGMSFSLLFVPPAWGHALGGADRFQLVLGGVAVLDRETGLVWERTHSLTTMNWSTALGSCIGRDLGKRLGWRLPSREELQSVLDSNFSNPALPAGHPFVSVSLATFYWSATTRDVNPAHAWVVYLGDGGSAVVDKSTNTMRAWCVRGGAGVDRQ